MYVLNQYQLLFSWYDYFIEQESVYHIMPSSGVLYLAFAAYMADTVGNRAYL